MNIHWRKPLFAHTSPFGVFTVGIVSLAFTIPMMIGPGTQIFAGVFFIFGLYCVSRSIVDTFQVKNKHVRSGAITLLTAASVIGLWVLFLSQLQ